MKTCPNCFADLEDNFEICWNCNYSLADKKVIEFPGDPPKVKRKELDCLRCKVPLYYSGVYKFHEGKNYGVYGELFEKLVNRESFDLYICPECRKVEFYLPQE